MLNQDSCDITSSEDDDWVIVLDDFVVSLCTDEAGGYEVAKLTMLQS
jgi:hypothetical protein